MKRLLVTLLVALSFVTTASAVDLYVDTNKISTDTPPALVEGRTLVPVRAIFESLGATVTWDQATKTATGVKDGTTVIIQIDNTTAYVNGEAKTLDVPAMLINNRTMVPARFVSEALNCVVTWNQETQTAAVANELKEQPIYVTKTGSKYHFSGTCNSGSYYEATLAEAMGRGLTPCDKCVLKEGVPPSANALTVSQQNAIAQAKSYLNFSAFSYQGLIDQLEYEGYSTVDATIAVDNCGADWFDQALKQALSYLDHSSFSYTGLIEQLEYEEFTPDQAKYGADNCGADWMEQAVLTAKSYLEYSSFSKTALIEQLEYEGFTHEQAVYGAEQNGF